MSYTPTQSEIDGHYINVVMSFLGEKDLLQEFEEFIFVNTKDPKSEHYNPDVKAEYYVTDYDVEIREKYPDMWEER